MFRPKETGHFERVTRVLVATQPTEMTTSRIASSMARPAPVVSTVHCCRAVVAVQVTLGIPRGHDGARDRDKEREVTVHVLQQKSKLFRRVKCINK